MKRFFTIILLTSFSIALFAQRYNISGTVIDKISGDKMPYANCVLHYKTDTLGIYKGEVSDTNGNFTFKRVKKRDLILEITYVGYKTFKKNIPISLFKSDKIINFGKIEMETLGDLDAVQITATRDRIVIDDDKMIVNIDEQIASVVTDAFDLLRLVPGVVIDNNENIKLNGKSGVEFQYNGREMNMGWEAIKDMLKSMSPEMIDQFEVLTDPGVKYDAEGTAGIINIKLKKNQHYGINGSVNMSANRQDRHIYGYRPSGRINFVNDKWMISSGVNYNKGWSGRDAAVDTSQRYTWINSDTTLFRSANGESSSTREGYGFDLSASYSIDTTSTLSLTASYSGSDNPYSKTNKPTYISHNPLFYISDSMYENISGSNSNNDNMMFSLEYVKKLDSLDSKISSEANFSLSSSKDYSIQEINYYKGAYAVEDSIMRSQGYKRNTDDGNKNFSWRVDYFKPFNKEVRFEAGIKTGIKWYDRDYVSKEKQGINYENNPLESNHFLYTENINSLYASIQGKFFKHKLSARIGLRLEQTNTKGEQTAMDSINKRSFWNLFPSVRIGYKFTNDNELSISYSYRISRPWSDDLNPFITKSSDYSFSTGNPFLEPQYSHRISLRHSYKYALHTSVSYSYTKDEINSISIPMDSSYGVYFNPLALISYPINFGSSEDVTFTLSYNKQMFGSWFISLTGDVNYDKTNSSTLKNEVNRELWSWSIWANTFATLPYKIHLNAFYVFTSASLWGTSKSNGWQYLSASIGKSFLDDKLSFNLFLSWNLNHDGYRENTYMNSISKSWTKSRPPRISVSVRYKFGKFYENKQVKRQQLENFDDRAGSSNEVGSQGAR